jgi:hypothetical protein
MGLGLLTPGCNCRITAERISACCNRIKWCAAGETALQIGSGYPFSVAEFGQLDSCEAGPFTLRSTFCGVTRTCSTSVTRCSSAKRRLRVQSPPVINYSSTTVRTCNDGGGSTNFRTSDSLIRSCPVVDVVMDFDYNANCQALVDVPIEINIGAVSESISAAGYFSPSMVTYNNSASESYNLTFRYDQYFPNGDPVPGFPFPLAYWDITDYSFSISATGGDAAWQNQIGCVGGLFDCFNVSPNTVRGRVFSPPILNNSGCLTDAARKSGGWFYGFGVRRAVMNALVCSTCTKPIDDDLTVPENSIWRPIFGLGTVTWSDIPC